MPKSNLFLSKCPIKILVLLLVVSCTKDEPVQVFSFPIGTYKGTFTRTMGTGVYTPTNVVITFSQYKFSGDSDKNDQPQICSGAYYVTGKEIEFINDCVPVDINWNFLLSGKYKATLVNGNELLMTQVVGKDPANFDEYNLTLQ